MPTIATQLLKTCDIVQTTHSTWRILNRVSAHFRVDKICDRNALFYSWSNVFKLCVAILGKQVVFFRWSQALPRVCNMHHLPGLCKLHRRPMKVMQILAGTDQYPLVIFYTNIICDKYFCRMDEQIRQTLCIFNYNDVLFTKQNDLRSPQFFWNIIP